MKRKAIINSLLVSLALMFQTASVLPSAAVSSENAVTYTAADLSGQIVSGGFYTLSPCVSELYITANKDGSVNQWESLSDSSQQWQIISTGGGYCRIVSAAYPSMALTVENGNSTNGNKIILKEYTGGKDQNFRLNKTADAYYVTAECSGDAALDVYGQSTENGAVIDQWAYWGGKNQKFRITPAGSEGICSVGDLNGDGKTGIADLVLMRSGCISGFDKVTASIADINNDGKNNAADILLMNEYFFGTSGTNKSTYRNNNQKTAYLWLFCTVGR